MEHKITTHIEYRGRHIYFSSAIDGRPLIGDRGGKSLFESRCHARAEAQRRIDAGLVPGRNHDHQEVDQQRSHVR